MCYDFHKTEGAAANPGCPLVAKRCASLRCFGVLEPNKQAMQQQEHCMLKNVQRLPSLIRQQQSNPVVCGFTNLQSCLLVCQGSFQFGLYVLKLLPGCL